MKTPQLPPLTKTGERRLLKLIEFLEKLPRVKFDFSAVKRESECVACALGYTPIVFPNLVEYISDGESFGCRYFNVRMKKWSTPYGWMPKVGAELFGITCDAATFLFSPNCQSELHEKLPHCDNDATPKQVARMLRKFIELAK